jgi:predicted RNA-binding Zn ribbon-like protein
MSLSLFIGEPLALDLINTNLNGPDGPLDVLASMEGLRAWLAAEDGRLSLSGATPTEGDAVRVRALREHTTKAIGSARLGQRPPRTALRAIGEARAASLVHIELVWNGKAVIDTVRRTGEPGDVLVAELAQAAIDLLTSPQVTAVRECAHPDCVLLFLPGHPGRQWCSPSLCGNRARVARYYLRHKTNT